MNYVLTIYFILFNFISYSQTTDTLKDRYIKIPEKVSFIAKVDIANATKDGIYLNGYIVHIDYKRVKKLNGRTIKVKGKVTVVKGLNNLPKEYDNSGNEIIKAGRSEDSKHILSPKIRIIE